MVLVVKSAFATIRLLAVKLLSAVAISSLTPSAAPIPSLHARYLSSLGQARTCNLAAFFMHPSKQRQMVTVNDDDGGGVITRSHHHHHLSSTVIRKSC